MINKEKTIRVNGVDPDTLAPTSQTKVWWKCDEDGCGAEREYPYAYALRKQEKAKEENPENPVELCQKCAHKHRKGKTATKKVEGRAWYPLPPEVDAQKTLERFGYDPAKLKPWSRKRVVVVCSVTNVECTPQRCGLNRNKAVMETGHFVSTGAYTGKRRKGVKVSEETKNAMAASQKARREREKAQKEQEKQENNSQTVPVVNVEA